MGLLQLKNPSLYFFSNFWALAPAHANTCLEANEIPSEVRVALFSLEVADYGVFLDALREYGMVENENLVQLTEILLGNFPDGFNSCHIVRSEFDGVFSQFISGFQIDGVFVLFFYVSFLDLEGEMSFLSLSVANDIGGVADNWF